jgi:hypothetical protein
LARTAHRRWSGHITVPGLGTGRIDMPGAGILFRRFTTGMGSAFRAQFPRGQLLACGGFNVSPTRRGYRWTAVAAITRASVSLHRYLGLTLRLDGFTAARDLTRVRAVMTTDDPPTGFWC